LTIWISFRWFFVSVENFSHFGKIIGFIGRLNLDIGTGQVPKEGGEGSLGGELFQNGIR
jgi:hypothetical protein